MADALAAIGLASAIVQFVDASVKVLKRVEEYRSAVDKVPEYQQKLLTRLPLLIDALGRTKSQANNGQVSEQTAKALKPIAERSLHLVKRLEEILSKDRPLMNDSKRKRILKAIKSVNNNKTVKDIVDELDSQVRCLTFHHATGNSSQVASPTVPTSPQGCEPQPELLETIVVRQTSPLPVVEPGQARCFTVKFAREENFVGREDIITEIDKRLREGQHRVAIAGIGGVGAFLSVLGVFSNKGCRKSQIAIEYCYRYKAAHPEANIFWVHGSNLSRFMAAYQEIARALAIPGMDQPNTDIFQLVSAWLNCEANGPWLLVLDNVDDIETMFGTEEGSETSKSLFNHLPHSSHGAMIITTRDQRIGERFVKQERPICVVPYGTEDAKRLLQISLRDNNLNDVDALALLKALDYLPLAISQAAAFMRENGVSLRGYLRSLEAGSEEVMALLAESCNDPARDHESQNSVFQTWKVSFESIRKQKPRAAEILSLMAVLDRQAIPTSLLQNDDELNVDFIKAIGTLKAFSLIGEQTEGASFGMHRLVQLATQRWLALEGSIEKWRKRALAAVNMYCTQNPSKTDDSRINPQVQAVLAFAFTSESCLVQRASVLNYASICEQRNGHYAASRVKSLEALAISEKWLEEENPLRMAIKHNLAVTIQREGKYKTAEEMLQQVLDSREKALGPNHRDTLLTMDQLGITLTLQAKCAAAEAVHQEALDRSSRALELEEFEKIQRIALMSNVRVRNGHYQVAATMKRQVFDAYEKILGPDDPETLWIEFGLANILFLQGEAGPAERITRRVLEGFRKAMGREHVSCLSVLEMLVEMVEFQCRWPEAEVLAREALTLHEKVLGHDHPRSICSRTALSVNLGHQGKFEAAEAIIAALDGLETFIREDHNILTTIHLGIASTLYLQGKYEEAEILYRRVLTTQERLLGPDDPTTLKTVHNLACLLHRRKQYSEATVLYQRACLGLQRTFGPDNIFTATCVEDFARLCRSHPDWRVRIPARLQRWTDHLASQMATPSQRKRVTFLN